MQVYRKGKKDWLGWLAMGSALAVSAVAEWSLAVACGFSPALAAGVPASLDIYSIKAMQTGEDIPYAVIAMIVVQALSHLVAAGVLTVSWPLIVLVSAIAPLVLWRMHVLNGKVSNPGVGVYTPQVLTSAQVDSHPVQVDTPEEPPASPKGVPVQVDAHRSEVNTPGEQQVFTPETERLSSERAREVIEQCFQEGLSTRAAAVRATRAPSFVAKVFKELKAA